LQTKKEYKKEITKKRDEKNKRTINKAKKFVEASASIISKNNALCDIRKKKKKNIELVTILNNKKISIYKHFFNSF
jgi:hypothetical protein